MITVNVSKDGEHVDKLEFNAVDVIAHYGSQKFVHSNVMQNCLRTELWYRVAHAAWIVAENRSMRATLSGGH